MKKYICLITILVLIFSSCSTEKEEPIVQSQYPAGSVFGPSGPTKIVGVTNPKTGKTWMDRNLGATRAATSSTDLESYGDLYQWGRRADGHQLRNSPTTTTLSSSDQPGNPNFILLPVYSPYDWRSPQKSTLWQGVAGVNNPCPTGYRIPTSAEWEAEHLSWGTNNPAGAFASPLKLPVAGRRSTSTGNAGPLYGVGGAGYYWCSTVSGTDSRNLSFGGSTAVVGTNYRSGGVSVRCIKN